LGELLKLSLVCNEGAVGSLFSNKGKEQLHHITSISTTLLSPA